MPDELQYLPDDKQREPDAKLRLMLVETLLQVGGVGVHRCHLFYCHGSRP